MLVIRVELHSAITGKVTEIARMLLCNDGTGTGARGNYWGEVSKGITDGPMIPAAIHYQKRVFRRGEVKNYARRSLHVWNLVARMLANMRFK